MLPAPGGRIEGGRRLRGIHKTSESGMPLITVITVVYNRAHYLKRAIESVISQDYQNVEYIVIDGGSTDGSLDIIRMYDESIDYWVSEPDQGMYYALNKGIGLSHGDLIGIVHSDDFFLSEDVLSRVANKAKEVSCDIYHGDALLIYEFADHCSFEKVTSNHTPILETNASIIHPSTFIRSTVFDDIGPYNVRFKSAADYELFVRCVKRNRLFCHLDFVVSGIYVCGADRVSNNCYSQMENYRIHKLHKTGNHRQFIISYLNCTFRRLLKKVISVNQIASFKAIVSRFQIYMARKRNIVRR